MPKRTLIRLTSGKRRFNYRIAGLGFRDGHVLVHRATHESFWTFPGGRAEIGETSEETLQREMVEELGAEVEVGRLLWVVENFFDFEKRHWHELGFYYLMTVPESFPFAPEGIVHRAPRSKRSIFRPISSPPRSRICRSRRVTSSGMTASCHKVGQPLWNLANLERQGRCLKE